MKALKNLLLILGLAFTMGAFAEGGDATSRLGEDQQGCGNADELKGCKCIKQSIADKEATVETGDDSSSGNGTGAGNTQ